MDATTAEEDVEGVVVDVRIVVDEDGGWICGIVVDVFVVVAVAEIEQVELLEEDDILASVVVVVEEGIASLPPVVALWFTIIGAVGEGVVAVVADIEEFVVCGKVCCDCDGTILAEGATVPVNLSRFSLCGRKASRSDSTRASVGAHLA